jgi:cation:H+ antiporter
MVIQLLVFLVGLGLLVVGANLFLRGAGGIALRFGISPFVVGMVLVGFGTSMPELAVNLTAVFEQRLDLAVGNVVGSNIANVGLILGAAALIAPMAIPRRVFRSELPVLVGLSLGFWLLVLDGRLGRIDAGILLAGFAVMMVVMARGSRALPVAVEQEIGVDPEQARQATWPHLWRLVVGLVLLLGGSKLMVDAAVALALGWGVSELVIGLTVVAIGTSLPELAASVVAALRGEAEIAVGNVLGSNVFNLLLILGITAMVEPLPVADSLIRIDIVLMIAFVLVLYPLALRRRRLGRFAGVLLLAGFVAFFASQFLRTPLA